MLFDICMVDIDAQSCCNHTPLAVLSPAKHEKKRKYSQGCQNKRATFTHLCVSVDVMMGHETAAFIKHISFFDHNSTYNVCTHGRFNERLST